MKISTKAQQALDDMSLGKKHTSLGSDDKTCTESPQTSIIYIYIYFFFLCLLSFSRKRRSRSRSRSRRSRLKVVKMDDFNRIISRSSEPWMRVNGSTSTKWTHPLCLFPNSNSFGVFSHSKGFVAELLSDSPWFSGADPCWAAKKFRGRFHQGSAKVLPRFHQLLTRFHQGSTKVSRRLHNFRDLSGLLIQIPFVSERILRRVPPITSWHLFLSSFNSFFAFFPKSNSFGIFSHSKGLGQNDTFCLLGFFAQMAFASQKVFWRTLFCTFVSESPAVFWGKWLLLQKRFCGGFPQLFSTFVSQIAWIVDMSQPYKSSPQKTTHHVIAVEVFCGIIPGQK